MEFRRKNIRLHSTHYRERRWFFVTLCSEARRPVFSVEKNALNLISCLKSLSEKYQFGVHAFCVMPDHLHALVEGLAPESNLLFFVRNLKQASSRDHSKGSGAILWQKKFYDHILRATDSPEGVSWYIWMNPVRKGLCNQPAEYPYSGSLTEEWERRLQPNELWTPTWKNHQTCPSKFRTASTKP